MANLLNLAMAAKMVGVTRGDVQKQIRNGKLHTFEGMIRVSELLRVYPNVCLEDTEMINFVAGVKEKAISKQHPDQLLHQIVELRKMLSAEHEKSITYLRIIVGLKDRLTQMQTQCDKKDKAVLETVMHWLGSQIDVNTIL